MEDKAAFIKKLLEDQKAIQKCIQEKGDLKKLCKERGIKLANPI